MTDQEKTKMCAELEEQLLGIIRDTEADIQNLNEVYLSAERAKREIESYYRLRRLQRLQQEAAA